MLHRTRVLRECGGVAALDEVDVASCVLQGSPGSGVAVLLNDRPCLRNEGPRFGEPALRIETGLPHQSRQPTSQFTQPVTCGRTLIGDQCRARDRIADPAGVPEPPDQALLHREIQPQLRQ
jgi:hypothetical protein